ncbi:amino acid adenylation domain-containing protein [Pseudomonas sp. BW13M1]|uniref:Amino acid adenylation domain-containing protein n=1 Tax=Pseudomonas peradeniyensis TaxID=2745488 RepID=A0A923GB02_9PSED|nr:non-ribosomal peptide synthetase [Pseudomonas peradeniyensis]MBV4504329.1 amino acid adenylation domain-containing protein [Pseudomonas peradeniyensis]
MMSVLQETVLARFAAQVQRDPQALAVIDRQLHMTYAELASASERIARGLQARGVLPGQALALYLPRGWQWLAALLGALKAGAVVMPLDRASPAERRGLMLADADCVGVLSLADAPQGLPGPWEASVEALLDHPDQPAQPLPENFAEVMCLFYTSGTTGVPKGVEVGERGLLRLAQAGSYIDIRPGQRFACLSNPAFDACSFELWAPLLNGGCVVMVADEDVLDARRLARLLQVQQVDTLFITVSLFNTLNAQYPACFASLRQVLTGGEQVSPVAVRAWYQANPDSACRLFNVYGPTECTTFALCHPIPRDFSGDSVPIGLPLPDTGMQVLDPRQQPVAPGEVGELYLSGSGVARGYRNRPEETARAFVRLPALDGGRQVHYRTGDLVRVNDQGRVECLGRVDRQIKVRGFRIEPGEVEQRLLEHPQVAQAYVCSRRQAAEDHQLLAFLVPCGELDYRVFDAYLRAHLAPWMRPHQLFRVPGLPLTANGKIDQERLLAQADTPWRPPVEAGEHSPALDWLLQQVRTLLGQSALGGQDDWLGSGGDSLRAMRLRSAIRDRWQQEISMATLLGEPFEALAERLQSGQGMAPAYPPAPAAQGARRGPASAEQRRLWLEQQRVPDSTAYNVPMVLHLAAGADPQALAEAVRRLVAKHPALRTAFVAGADGPEQVVGEQAAVCRVLAAGALDDSTWPAFASLVFDTPFELASPTLLRAWVAPHADGSCRLLLNLHHIVTDGWSMNLLFDDLASLYQDALQGQDSTAATLALDTLDFALWQRQWSVSPHYREQRRALATLHARHGEATPPRPARYPGETGGRLYRQPLGERRSAALERFCTEQRLTRFDVLFSVFAWSLHALVGCERPRIASPVANRPLAEFEASVGMFANTVLIPTDLQGSQALDEQLRRQTATVREVLALQDVALADLVEDLRLSSDQALFDYLFVLENTEYAKLAAAPLRASLEPYPTPQAKCPLTLLVVGGEGPLECWWEYQCSHFDAHEVAALDQLLQRGLDLLLEDPRATLDSLVAPYRQSLPPASEGLAATLPFATLADWFEHQAQQTPEATALVAGQRRLSYAQLNALADTLAATLSSQHARDESATMVLFLAPSVEHVVALLALAKLNITAVPLDPNYPVAVQRQVLAQARPDCVLFSSATETALAVLDAERLSRHRVDLEAPARSLERLRHNGERPLYTLFTSGSTGTPKGVQVADRTLCNLLHWQRHAGQLPARSVTLQFSMLSFDVAFQELYGTLCGGGCYHLIEPHWRQDAQALLTYLQQARIERLFLPCVALQHLAQAAVAQGIYPAALREVVTAGEQLLCSEALRSWFGGMPKARLFNHYGPTETHVVSAYALPAQVSDWPLRAPIGQAVDNARLLLVDAHDRPVPPGNQGYLLVAGAMVARCYLADAVLNAERFVELPQADGNRCLYYRTGDLAWVDAQGCLHYMGRDDQQVKLSGHRLELGQVESALMAVAGVANAVVTVQGEPSCLTAYLQLTGMPPSAQDLDHQVARHLPAHVRIDQYRRLDSWPRTPSGKVDRKALAGQGEALERRRVQAATLTPLESQLAALFREVIGHDIEPMQTFFEAGATSLGLMRLQARYVQALPGAPSMAELFEHVTIRRLAAHLARAEAAPQRRERASNPGEQPMAIIGMAVNVAGARDLGEFWTMVQGNALGIEHFQAGEGLVGARSQLQGMLDFDPEYFGISRQEARLMDPQQRHLLMACVQALQHAAIVPAADGPRIGLVASCGETTYFQQLLRENGEGELPDGFQLALHHDKDFLATKAAYHLDLTGPALSVQAACGSSLIGVHLACNLLRQGDSDVMLAAGVLIDPTLSDGYRHRSQHIFSRDGLCRPFSEDASGTLGASGYGVVVLKPLARARADGDRIYALVEGSALNNDGRGKMSYTAPSVAGQGAVIAQALERAGAAGADIGYVEAHGTGTLLGDPVEVAALTHAFGEAPAGSCALASVKSQIGHLGAAAGVVGLIRATLAVYHGVIPPNLGFSRINPQIDLACSPFHIPTTARPWPSGRRRMAGVSSFGIGGTNAHVIVGAVQEEPQPPEDAPPLLLLSAHSREALERDIAATDAWLRDNPGQAHAVLRHLQAGRRQGRWRFAAPYQAGDALPLSAIREVTPTQARIKASEHAPDDLLTAWYEGAHIEWPGRSAPPPWNLPPASFDLQAFRFQGQAAAQRQPLADWFHQRQWQRVRRLGKSMAQGVRQTLVVCVREAVDDVLLATLGRAYQRVVQVQAGQGYRQLATDRFELDVLDTQALGRLLEALPGELDWLHALPLSVTGAVDEQSLAAAQWACLDTPSSLLQAWGQAPRDADLRLWLLSWQACPVQGAVARPELAALAGVTEVAPQEYPLRCHWLDCPSPSLGEHANALATLLAEPEALPRRMVLREGYLWQPRLVPSPLPSPTAPGLAERGTYLILGAGGIGRTLCQHLLRAADRRVVLLSRSPVADLDHERVDWVQADLADLQRWPQVLEALARRYGRFDGVIHAAGIGAGSLIRQRDARQMAIAMAAKTRGMLAVEALIARMAPDFVLYCSSMSALFGGAGHLDYAAANAVLDGFSHYRAAGDEGCLRLGINWDIWCDTGMATRGNSNDAAHQQHLKVGLSAQEGCEVFERAMAAQLPQVLVSTTALHSARRFYPRRHGAVAAPVDVQPSQDDLPTRLRDCLCQWLGVDSLEDDASLYDLGADSLTLLDLIDELQRATGVVVQLSQFSPHVSLREVLALVDADPGQAECGSDPWREALRIDPWQQGDGRQCLYLIHPVGGDVQAYRELAAALHPSLGVRVIADPVLRQPELANLSLAARAQLYLEAIQADLPDGASWGLLGWSFGAWVAQAVCALAREAGHKPPTLYLVDPPAPDAGTELRQIDEGQIQQVFEREFALRNGESDGARYLERLVTCCRNNLASMLGHVPATLAGPTGRLFIATRPNPYGIGSGWQTQDLRQAWQALLPDLDSWTALDTDHYGIVTGPLARQIAEAINADLLRQEEGVHGA